MSAPEPNRAPHPHVNLFFSIVFLSVLPYISSLSTKSLDAGGVRSDVKYIKCEVCTQVAKAATTFINEMPSKSLDQLKILDKVENICDPTSKQGRWARTIDLVERLRKLRLIPQQAQQKCGRECHTMALACRAVLDTIETELAERLYVLRKPGNDLEEHTVEQWLCAKKTGASDACRSTPPLLPKDRQEGPPFVPRDTKEVETEELMEQLKSSGAADGMDLSMLNRDQAMGMVNKDDEDGDEDEDDFDDDYEGAEDDIEDQPQADDDDNDDEETISDRTADADEHSVDDTTLGDSSTLLFEEDSTHIGDAARKAAERAAGVNVGSDEL